MRPPRRSHGVDGREVVVVTLALIACASVARSIVFGAVARAGTTTRAPSDDGRFDAAFFARDRAMCATHASDGTWRFGAEACEPGAWALASAGCDDGAARRAFGWGTAARGRKKGSAPMDWVVRSDVGEICGFGPLRSTTESERVRRLIRGRRVAFVGDSVARGAYAAFVRATSEPWVDVSLKTDDGEKHRDWTHNLVADGRATFTWAPYAENAAAALDSSGLSADLIVVSSALWHILHDDSVSTYRNQMKILGERVREIANARPDVVFVWLDAPHVVASKLVAEDKRRKFTKDNLAKYAAIQNDQKSTKLVQPAGAFVRARVTGITEACGDACSVDGVHSVEVVYDVVAQIVLNLCRARWR